MTGAASARISLAGKYLIAGGESLAETDFKAIAIDGSIRIEGPPLLQSSIIKLLPVDFHSCRFTVHDVTIGVDFHWQRNESQQFQGALELAARPDGLTVINEIPIESYLVSVISSEMSASCPPELLRAHAIASRSWLLAQMEKAKNTTSLNIESQKAEFKDLPQKNDDGALEIIKWYDRENHSDFDVCADDHCQRYQGISKAFSQSAFDAVGETRGKTLIWDDY